MTIKRLVLAVFVVFTSFSSCVNYFAARDIMHNYPKHYNGIDTLIRIDGYYYFSDEQNIRGPIFLYTDGTLRTANFIFENHKSISAYLMKNSDRLRQGSFNIVYNSIQSKWASRFDVLSYDLYEETFLIKNDTTLLRVFRNTTASEQRVNKDTVVYRFHPFELNMKK